MKINKTLLIDDDVICRYLISKIIENNGNVNEILMAANGLLGLEFLEKLKRKNTFPEIIFVDINMPEMDGYEFIEHFENIYKKEFPRTKIYVLSSSTLQSDIEKTSKYESVMTYISKPLTGEVFESILNNIEVKEA